MSLQLLARVLGAYTIASLSAAIALAPSIARADTRMVVQFRSLAVSSAAGIIADHGGKFQKWVDGGKTAVITVPTGEAQGVLARFRARSDVAFAEVDRRAWAAQVVPNDPWYLNWQRSYDRMNCTEAWGYTTGDSSIVVAVLDSGLEVTHPEYAGRAITTYNVLTGKPDVPDSFGHGTAVSGVLGAATNNGVGVASAVWGTRFMAVKVADFDSAYLSDIAAGLYWAANNGARVANISWSPLSSSAFNSAAQYFRSKGGVVVTSAGNSSSTTGLAENPNIITVSATGLDDVLLSYSSYGSDIDVSGPAPVYTTKIGSAYMNCGGTSISAPHVAGVCALILSANPALTPAEVENILEQSADDLGEPGWDKYYGWGRVNAGRAVLMALGTSTLDAMPPSAKIEDPAVEGTVLTGLKTLWATADDDRGVAWVRFRVDGVAVSQQLTSAPYTETINTENWADGTHEISVVACDTSGNTTTVRRTVTFLNNDTIPPTISITSPADGSSFSRTLTVEVSVWDNLRISHVEAYIDGVKLGSTSTAPYTMKPYVRNLSKGNHTLYCVAYDGKLNKGYSQTITISNAGGGGGGGGKGNGK